MIEWAVILMAVLLCTVLLRTYVVQSFYIPSPSMVPTLQVGDRIMVNKLSYDLHGVHRGDIVVFKRPPLEEQDFPDLVKRVVGLPGETISTRNGHVYINGKLLAEPWLPPGPPSYTGALPDDQHPQFNMPGPVHDPGRRVLRHGGQPHRLRGQPVLRPDPEVADRGAGRRGGLAAQPRQGRLSTPDPPARVDRP